ncbi:transposase [Streptomyces sp. NPDC094438]|uniref:IS110 family transposase n=1 Tax=Streptomyces sp. NPDC094438 TaxID=3366061 RepID=UPI00382C1B5F
MLAEQVDGVIGVDTHRDTFAAAAVSPIGAVLATMDAPANARGYRRLLDFARNHIPGRRCWALEGIGSYVAGLATFLDQAGERVVEVCRPKRPAVRGGPKTDMIDAIRAAKEALASERPLSWNVTTGLDSDQLGGLVARVHAELVAGPDPAVALSRMWALGLYKSVVLVLYLLLQNPVQEAAAELFGVSQSAVSRRWTVVLPLVEKVLAARVPDPVEASVGRIDGTLVTTWDWAGEGTAMFSGKHRDTGFNLQAAATLSGELLAVSVSRPEVLGQWSPIGSWSGTAERARGTKA